MNQFDYDLYENEEGKDNEVDDNISSGVCSPNEQFYADDLNSQNKNPDLVSAEIKSANIGNVGNHSNKSITRELD